MKLTIAQNGDFVKEYFNSGQYGREFILYDGLENMFYGKYKHSDTLIAFRGDGADVLILEEES